MNKYILPITILFLIVGQAIAQIKEGKTYMIIASHSNKPLEIKASGDGFVNGLQLQQNDSTGKPNQLFSFKKLKGGYYQIISQCNNKSLEVRNGSLHDHEVIQQNEFNGADYQQFTLVKNLNGTYAIVNKNSGYGFDVLGGSKSFANNMPIIQYPVLGAANQAYRIVDIDKYQGSSSNLLQKHPFLYTGEWDYRKPMQNMFVVRDGKIVWSYGIPLKNEKGEMEELGDATMLKNGNIVFCRKVGASMITPDKQIIWNIAADPGCEIHSVQPIGLDKVLVVQNGNPAKAMFINTKKNKTEKVIVLPSGKPGSSHLQFRRVRLTSTNTILAAHLDNNKVAEYNLKGKEIWAYTVNGPWGAVRLKNGNTLISSYPSLVTEVNKKGEVVWEFSDKDVPNLKCFIFQEVSRLENGNTLICNWCPVHLKETNEWTNTVQVLEVSPDKKVVSILNEWNEPLDLGPASSIQLLDEVGNPNNGELQR